MWIFHCNSMGAGYKEVYVKADDFVSAAEKAIKELDMALDEKAELQIRSLVDLTKLN